MKIKLPVIGWLALLALPTILNPHFSTARAATFSISPATVSNTYSGQITLTIGGVGTGGSVVVQKFLNLNTNGVINGSDWLMQQFTMTDGQRGMVIDSVTNFNVPGDTDTTAGQITAKLNFNASGPTANFIGKYLFKVSGNFTPPITNTFTVTNFAFPQKFTGNVISNNTSKVLSNSIVLLMSYPQGVGIAASVANNAGAYTLAAPAGNYLLVAFRSNYLASPVVVTLGSGATVSTNLTMTKATAGITGKIVDANNSNIGMPGILMTAQANGLMGVGFSDSNGNYTVRVQSGQWKVKPNDQDLITHGYLGLEGGTNVNAGATGVNIAVPKATALVYGSVKDNLGKPMAGIDVYANDDVNRYQTDGFTDTNGNYVVGVLGNASSEMWWVQVSSDSGPTNYVFTQQTIGGNITNNTATLQNFTSILAVDHISGNVKFNGTNVVDVWVWANADIGGVYYQTGTTTDGNGNYMFNVANGSWTVGLQSNGGNNGLDNILGPGTYQQPGNDYVTIANNDGTANFTVLPCTGVHIFTTSLPDGQVNSSYDTYLSGSTCSSSSQNWWLNDPQNFPSSLTLGSDGHIYGTPDTTGYYNFSVHLDDGNGNGTDQNLSLNITADSSNPPPLTTGAGGGQILVFWPASCGTNYTLEMTTNLATGPWVTCTDAVPQIAFTITNKWPAAFFRVH